MNESDGLAVVQARLEATRERHQGYEDDWGGERRNPLVKCMRCGARWPCADYSDADTALAALVVERERATTRDEQIRELVHRILYRVERPYEPRFKIQADAKAIRALLGAGGGA